MKIPLKFTSTTHFVYVYKMALLISKLIYKNTGSDIKPLQLSVEINQSAIHLLNKFFSIENCKKILQFSKMVVTNIFFLNVKKYENKVRESGVEPSN